MSIVLNGKQGAHRIAPETVRRIHEAMAELRYGPHAVAQALAHGRTNTIGVVLGRADMTYLTHPYYGPILQGIVRFAFDQRRFVLLYHGRELGAADLDATSYADGRCDGLILTPPFSAQHFAAPLVDLGFPFVTVGDLVDDPRFPGVDIDNEAAARELAEYLLRHGHRRILCLARRGYSASTLRRLAGCRRRVEQANGGVYEEDFLPRDDERGTLEALRRWLIPRNETKPTALFCLTDEIAVEVIGLLRQIGIAVPRDISVVGFDDAPAASAANLTTMRQEPSQIGEEATGSPASKIGFTPIDIGRAGRLSGAAPYTPSAAPRTFPPPPRRRYVDDDFEDTVPGDRPSSLLVVVSEEGVPPAATVRVSNDTALSGTRSLKITDVAGQQHS